MKGRGNLLNIHSKKWDIEGLRGNWISTLKVEKVNQGNVGGDHMDLSKAGQDMGGIGSVESYLNIQNWGKERR